MKKMNLRVTAIAAICAFAFMTACTDENSSPAINSVKISPDGVHAGGYVKVSVTADDPDNDLITYKYEVSGGSITEDGSYAYWKLPSTAGSATITVTTTDDNGNKDSETKTVTVLDPVTQVSGYAKLATGETGSLDGVKVYLHPTGAAVKIMETTGSGNGIVFNVTGIEAGEYWLNIYKDTDNSGAESVGDYFGWYGTGGVWSPDIDYFNVAAGETFSCSITMYHPL